MKVLKETSRSVVYLLDSENPPRVRRRLAFRGALPPHDDLLALRHPHLQPLEHVATYGDRVDLHSLWMPGEELQAGGDPRGVIRITVQLLQLLDYLHGKGFKLGSLDRSDIVLAAHGPVLVDLALGERMRLLPWTAGEFKAPERTPDERADLFAVGALAFWMLTGQVPEVTSLQSCDTLYRTLLGAHTTLPRDFFAVLLQLLDFHPTTRPESAAEALQLLCRFDDARPTDGTEEKSIGAYRVVQLIGEGGMARVYRVRRNGVEYALKCLHPHMPLEPGLRHRMERDIEIYCDLRHENVCRVTDWGLDDKSDPFIVMELLKGQVLRDHLLAVGAPLQMEDVRPIVRQVLHGLDALHSRGVVHRDLKPTNVYLTSGGSVKVMDPGLVGHPGLGPLMPGFLSPELLRQEPNLDHRSDLFTVGAMVYQMLTFHLPFEDSSIARMLARLEAGQMTPLHTYAPHIKAGVVEWVETTMAVDPNRRFQSAAAAAQALERWI